MKTKDNHPKQKEKNQKINDEIEARTVRVIGPDGEKLGILSIDDALYRASSIDLDLVEVAPTANPPVCRIIDYGKVKYNQAKKQKHQKKSQHKVVTKMVKMKPNIDGHDLERKIAEIQKFLDKKFNVTVQVVLKGRQRNFTDLAQTNTIERVKEALQNFILKNVNKQPNRITADFAPQR